MTWLLATLGLVLCVELLLRMPLATNLKKSASVAVKAGKVLRSKSISDHWKEKVLLIYSREIFRAALTSFAFLLLALTPLTVIAWSADMAGLSLFNLLFSPLGIAGCTLIITVYLLSRKIIGR